MPDPYPYDPVTRLAAANNVYDSIPILVELGNGFQPDPGEPEAVRRVLAQELYDSNLNFLKATLNSPYYNGYLDTETVQAAIDYAEAHPPNPEPPEGGGGEG
jgi:hypothetical protein